jgi:hypothetical protein
LRTVISAAFALSGLGTVANRDLTGFALAGLGTVANRDLSGVALGGLALVTDGGLSGAGIAGFEVWAEEIRGWSSAAYVNTRALHGVSVAAYNRVRGLQVAVSDRRAQSRAEQPRHLPDAAGVDRPLLT